MATRQKLAVGELVVVVVVVVVVNWLLLLLLSLLSTTITLPLLARRCEFPWVATRQKLAVGEVVALGVQKRRPHYLNCISSSPHHMCHCSVSIHIFGQTGTYYLNYSSGSPHYICQFSLFGLQCFFTHIWAEWKYLSRVPSVAPPMCQSALDYTGWFCAVKYLIAS